MGAAGRLASMILWGPPGTGKTTIARLLADAVGLRFIAISAVFSGVADLKKAFAEAREHARMGTQTPLFVDEIHCFNSAQQDVFLPYVEDMSEQSRVGKEWVSTCRFRCTTNL